MVCSEQLNYENFIKKFIAGQDCCISYKAHTGCYFKLSPGGENISVFWNKTNIQTATVQPHICARCIKKIRLSSLTYKIVNINKRVTYITNEVLTSKHDCVLEVCTCNLDFPKRLAGCNLYTQRSSAYPQKDILSKYYIVESNLTACSVTVSAIVNCVSKRVLQV